MAIGLHKAPTHQSDFLIEDGRRWTDRFVPAAWMVDERVSAMTTMAANLDVALSMRQTTAWEEQALESCSCGFELIGHGEAYNESAFHHFLAIERRRSEVSARPFLLLLVEFERHQGGEVSVEHDWAPAVFSALGQALRDTDVIGWYREHRIAGAVLTDLGEAPQTIMPTISERVRRLLQGNLPADVASLVKVRLYQMPARAETAAALPALEFA